MLSSNRGIIVWVEELCKEISYVNHKTNTKKKYLTISLAAEETRVFSRPTLQTRNTCNRKAKLHIQSACRVAGVHPNYIPNTAFTTTVRGTKVSTFLYRVPNPLS